MVEGVRVQLHGRGCKGTATWERGKGMATW